MRSLVSLIDWAMSGYIFISLMFSCFYNILTASYIFLMKVDWNYSDEQGTSTTIENLNWIDSSLKPENWR